MKSGKILLRGRHNYMLDGSTFHNISNCLDSILCRHQQRWPQGIQDHTHLGGGAHGLSRPGLLPPLSDDTRGARKSDRRSRSPKREENHCSSKKRNAARRREYVKEEKKVRF